MPRNYIFTYSNCAFIQTKSFELLIQSIKSSQKQIGIVVNNIFEKNNIENLILDYTKQTKSSLQCFFISEIIDLHYRINYSSYQHVLDHYFKTFLFNNNENEFSNLLYQSKTLRADFLNSYFISDIYSNNQLELDILKTNDVSKTSYNLISKFNKFFTMKLKVTKKMFYNNIQKHPSISQISHLFFINSHIENNFTKNQIKLIFPHFKSFSWIINSKQKKTIEWINNLSKETDVINENTKQGTKFHVNTYSTLSEEIRACKKNIIKIIEASPQESISIIVPEQNEYKHSIENEIIKLNRELNVRYNIPHKITKMKSFFLACLDFIKRPFSLESLLILSSNSFCKSIDIKGLSSQKVIFNIYELILLKQSNQDTFNYQNHNQNNFFDLESFTIEKKETIELILETQSKFHKLLNNFDNLDQWISNYQHFIYQFSTFVELKKEKKSIKDVKKILETMGTRLIYIKKSTTNKFQKNLIIDCLRDSIENISTMKPTYKSQITLYSINQARYLKHQNCFILGFCNSLYKPKKQNSLFASIFANEISQSEISRKAFQENVLSEISKLSESLEISMSTLINEEIQLPSIASNIILQSKKNTDEHETALRPPVGLNPKLISSNTDVCIHSLSASQLDQYNGCPYRFWLENIVKLKSLKADKEEISASHWGTFIHSILNQFNIWLLKQPIFSKSKSLSKITAIAHNDFDKIIHKNIFWKTKFESLISYSTKTGILEQIIDIYEEVSYLNKLEKTEHKFSTSIKNVTIKATIDALFKTTVGDVVLDYKTGKSIPSSKDIQLLRSLQLPIYFLCLQKTKNTLPQAGVFFQILNKETVQVHLKSCTKDIKEEYLKKTKQRPFLYDTAFINQVEIHIEKLVELIKGNYFSTQYIDAFENTYKNRTKLCQFCNYKISCRYPERMSL